MSSEINHLARAFDTTMKKDVWVYDADKTMILSCVECERRVCFKNGRIRKPHFAHHRQHAEDRQCTYLSKYNETQLHRDAKLCIKRLLQTSGFQLIFVHKCFTCGNFFDGLNVVGDQKSKVECEIHSRKLGRKAENWIADVVRFDPFLIVEVRVSHSTRTPRPDPWFEIQANDLVCQIPLINQSKTIRLTDVSRAKLCEKCTESKRQKVIKRWQLILERKSRANWNWYLLWINRTELKHIRDVEKKVEICRKWRMLLERRRKVKRNIIYLRENWTKLLIKKHTDSIEIPYDDKVFICLQCNHPEVNKSMDKDCAKCGQHCFRVVT